VAEVVSKQDAPFSRLLSVVEASGERLSRVPKTVPKISSLEQFSSHCLHTIGAHYCVDKSYPNRTAALSYLQIYEMYFERFRHLPVDIVEIGVRDGASVDMWNKYFANANSIYGVEIDDTWWESLLKEHVHYVQGDATEPAILSKFPSEQKFDIIIDDGSHINEQIIKSFEIFYPRLKSGGVYVIEDLYNSYGRSAAAPVNVNVNELNDGLAVKRDFSELMRRNDPEIEQILGGSRGIEQNNREQLREWLNQIEKNLNNPQQDILYIHHWDSIIIIGKV